MTQIATRDTVDVDEAIETLYDKPRKKAVRVGTGDDGVAYIRHDKAKNHDTRFEVNVYVPVVEARVNVTTHNEASIRDAIFGAESAQLIDLQDEHFAED